MSEETTETKHPKPLFDGKFIFDGLQEGEGEDKRILQFQPRLTIDYTIWNKTDEETGIESYPEDVPMMGYATFDFGMKMNTPLDAEHNWLVNGYEGLSKDSSPEEILMKTLMYDLMHAFYHTPDDPNFSHYHWALNGWLKDRTSVMVLC